MDWVLVIGAFLVLWVILYLVFLLRNNSEIPGVSGFFVALAVVFFGGLFVGKATGEIESNGERDVVALSTNSEVSGRFFLGSGYIGEDPVYTYMYSSGEGVRMGTIPADKTTVIETDTQDPRIVAQDQRSPWVPYLDAKDFESSAQFVVYVPEGSVYTGFDVDVRDAN